VPIEMKKRLARLTSNILNPFLVSFAVIIVLSFESTSSTADALKWSVIAIALSVLPVFIVIVFLVRNHKLESIFVNARRQRNKIYLLASAFAVVGCVVLPYLGAPRLLVTTFIAGLAAILIFMGINLLWKISLHTAFITASVTIFIIVYSSIGALTAVLLPPVAWARIELEHHSPAQVATGALLAASIVVLVFLLYGLIGSHA
jgi:membrane-associated phospholipid phosphatase